MVSVDLWLKYVRTSVISVILGLFISGFTLVNCRHQLKGIYVVKVGKVRGDAKRSSAIIRIHGAAIYMVTWIPVPYPPVMLALIYQHHGSYGSWGI